MSPGVRGTVERRVLVNYRVGLGELDTELPDPFRAREVGETGKGIGTVCLTRVENARPAFAPARAGLSVRSVTHRIPAEIEGEGRFCAYVPVRGFSSRLCAAVGRHMLPADIRCAEFRTEKKLGVRRTSVNFGKEYVGVEETMEWVDAKGVEAAGSETPDERRKVATIEGKTKERKRTGEKDRDRDRDRCRDGGNSRTTGPATKGTGETEPSQRIDEDSVFYSVESASVFLCEAGAEYMPASHRDGQYKRVEPSAEERSIEPANVTDSKSSYFEKLGGEFDSAFSVEGIRQEWEIGSSVTRR